MSHCALCILSMNRMMNGAAFYLILFVFVLHLFQQSMETNMPLFIPIQTQFLFFYFFGNNAFCTNTAHCTQSTHTICEPTKAFDNRQQIYRRSMSLFVLWTFTSISRKFQTPKIVNFRIILFLSFLLTVCRLRFAICFAISRI